MWSVLNFLYINSSENNALGLTKEDERGRCPTECQLCRIWTAEITRVHLVKLCIQIYPLIPLLVWQVKCKVTAVISKMETIVSSRDSQTMVVSGNKNT